MRIALVIERMDPSRGGRETSTAQIASALAHRGHDVTVLCQSGVLSHAGVRVVELGRRGLTRARGLANFVTDVQRAAGGGVYDIVHATLPVPGASVYQPRGGTVPGQVAASRRRRGATGPIRGALFEPLSRHRRRMADLECLVAADTETFCLPVSEMVADEFRRAYGRQDRLRVVYNAVQTPPADCRERAEWRQRLRLELDVGAEAVVFLVVAKNFPLKGVPETIVAFAKWRQGRRGQAPARLVVVGSETPEQCRRIARRRNVSRQVVFVGPTDDIFQWYAAADACILLSWYDPCSRVVLEATRWGIPSVTTAFNGACEMLVRSGGGLVVDSPRDTDGVVACLETMSDPDARAGHAEACRAVADTLGMDRHVDQLLEVYAEAAGVPS